jgi:hypothetical protein
MLLGIAGEIEVELRDPLLDDAPHRFAEVGHEAHHRQRRGIRLARDAEVGAEEFLLVLCLQLVVDREVREIEEDVTHARVLPVDDPDPIRVADEVRVQEVVVAGPQRLATSGSFDPTGEPVRLGVRGRQLPSRALDRGRVRLDDAERVELRRERRPGVESGERVRHGRDRVRRSEVVGRHRAPVDEARDECALASVERDDLRSDACRGRSARGGVLGPPVDSQELRVLAADPKHVRLVADVHAEVVIRDAATEPLDPRALPRPKLCGDRSRQHAQ